MPAGLVPAPAICRSLHLRRQVAGIQSPSLIIPVETGIQCSTHVIPVETGIQRYLDNLWYTGFPLPWEQVWFPASAGMTGREQEWRLNSMSLI